MGREGRKFKKIFQRAGILLITLVIALSIAQPGQAAYGVINRKISGTMADNRRVINFKISPDSQHVVFAADRDTLGMDELYVVPAFGGTEPLKISGEIHNGGSVNFDHFLISSNSQRVVFMADAETVDVMELYSVSLAGGARVKLNSVLTYNGDVDTFKISPNGQYVVYQADQATDEVYELYAVPIDGSAAPVKLNGTLLGGSVSNDYEISPNNLWIVYRAQENTAAVTELYRNGPAGLARERLNTGATGDHSVADFMITPNTSGAAGVVFTCNPGTGKTELFSNLIGTPAVEPWQLSNIVPADGLVRAFNVTPDGTRVVYEADQEVNDRIELYSNLTVGGDPHNPGGTLPLGTSPDGVLVMTSNSTRVVYLTYIAAESLRELYSNTIATDIPPVKLSPDGVTSSGACCPGISNNDSRVVYADWGAAAGTDIYSVPITGPGASGEPRKLNRPWASATGALRWHVSPNGLWIIYVGRQDTADREELYLNSTLGGTPIKLNEPLANGLDSIMEDFTPNSQAVVFMASPAVPGKYELFIAYLGWQVHLPLVKR